jgi:23S rRNA (cytidine1920-2'-O)/16S rRNA (cytidine1409-2'-O)-methyltransferase
MIEKLFRIDQLMVMKSLAKSRTQSKELIEAGYVTCDKSIVRKPSTLLHEDAALAINGKIHPWVSRGGLKLVAALDLFEIEVYDKVCMDIGASTGGFTDVLLAKGAKKIYAIDVGIDQLSESLVQNKIVINLEKTDARDLNVTLVPDLIDIVVCDVSFISLRKVMPIPIGFVKPGGMLVCLLKPQFEAGPGRVDKRGILRDNQLRQSILTDASSWFAKLPDWNFIGSTVSPLKGRGGNIEFLIVCSKKY